MVMFKAKFKPLVASDKPRANDTPRTRDASQPRKQQAQQPQPVPPMPNPQPQVPPIEDERGPQVPVREPGPKHEPERVS
jgi:hypothetical protein